MNSGSKNKNKISVSFLLKRVKLLPLFFLILLFAPKFSTAITEPPKEKVRILFIFDASQSMLAYWQSGKKIDGAKKILLKMVDSLARVENVEIALRVYGHQTMLRTGFTKDCKDSKLEVPFAANNHNKIKAKLAEIVPKGTTPIAYSLEQSANDFPDCSTCRNIIVLITDGIEECDGDPCAMSMALFNKGITLKPFVIGIGLGPEMVKEFECVGKYYDAQTEEGFSNILNLTVSRAVMQTTTQISLLDIKSKPTETNVGMTMYNLLNGSIAYNYVHSLNHKGNPDTLILDSEKQYKLVVHTVPAITKEQFSITPGIHNTIPLDAAQGNLTVKFTGFNEYKNLQVVVRQKGKSETLNIQEINKVQKYLVGKYDLEVLSLPRIILNDVEIKQSHTTTIEIPQPGMALVVLPNPGYTSLYVEEQNNLRWIANIEENKTRHNIVLQPGNYRIVYRPGNSKESAYTKERNFTIEPGGSVSIQFLN
jgi:Ca-activated chloride channel homolog